MKRFRFRLDPLLRLRNHELDQCRMQLGQALSEVERALERTKKVRRNAQEGSALIARWSQQGVTPPELAAGQLGTFDLYREIKSCEAGEAVVREAVAQARSRVVEAQTRLRTVEILKERALAEHRAETMRVEQAELDEVAGRLARATR